VILLRLMGFLPSQVFSIRRARAQLFRERPCHLDIIASKLCEVRAPAPVTAL